MAQAFTTAWAAAIDHARTAAEERLREVQSACEARARALDAEHARWAADRELAVDEARQARTACGAAEQRAADLGRLIEQQTAQLTDLTAQRDALQGRVDTLAAELVQVRTAHHEQASAITSEREANQAHIRRVEDRAHGEVDRTRQELKGVQKQLEQAQREAASAARAADVRCERAEIAQRTAEQKAAAAAACAHTLEQQLARLSANSAVKPRRTNPARKPSTPCDARRSTKRS